MLFINFWKNVIKIKSVLCSIVKYLSEEITKRGLFEGIYTRVPQLRLSLDIIYTKQVHSYFNYVLTNYFIFMYNRSSLMIFSKFKML